MELLYEDWRHLCLHAAWSDAANMKLFKRGLRRMTIQKAGCKLDHRNDAIRAIGRKRQADLGASVSESLSGIGSVTPVSQ